jgi:GMP synthase-like glutamine amidotransferase
VDDGHAWITAVCALVREAHSKQKALIGMCFGHQLVAHALGGVSSPAPPFNIGVDEITLHSARARQLLGERTSFTLVSRYYSMGKADLNNLSSPLPMLQYKSHGRQVSQVPPGCEVIASSVRTPVEMFWNGRSILCVQVWIPCMNPTPPFVFLKLIAPPCICCPVLCPCASIPCTTSAGPPRIQRSDRSRAGWETRGQWCNQHRRCTCSGHGVESNASRRWRCAASGDQAAALHTPRYTK